MFSSVSSVVTRRSSSGKRPTSAWIASRCSPAAWRTASSRVDTAAAVASTRWPGGPTMRTENCRGSAGGRSSLPRPSSTFTAAAAASTAAPTTTQRRRSRKSTSRSSAPKAQPRGRSSASPGPVDACVGGFGCRFTGVGAGPGFRARQEPARQGRNQHHRDGERSGQRRGDGEGDALDQPRGQPLHEEDGQEDDAGGQRRGGDRPRHFARAAGGALGRRHAGPVAPMDALDDDDRVVHQHAGAEGQPGQGDDVERVVPEAHREQGDEEGHGHRGSDDDGRTEGAQEQDQHDDRERDADQRGVLQVGHRVLDQGGVVVHHRHLDPGQVEFQVFERGPDGARDLDRVRAGLLEHLQADALAAVHPHQVVDLGVGDFDLRDVGYPDRLAGLLARGARLRSVPDDDALHVARIAEARDAADQEDLSPVLQGAGVDVDVLGHEPLLELTQGDAERLHAVAVDPHAHFQLPSAQHPHLGDVGELLHGGRHLPAGQAPEFGEIGTVRLGGQPRVMTGDCLGSSWRTRTSSTSGSAATGLIAFWTSIRARSMSASQSKRTVAIRRPVRATCCTSRMPRTVNRRCSTCSP